MFKSIPIRLSILLNFFMITAVGVTLIFSVQFYFSNKMAISAAESLFDKLSSDVNRELVTFDKDISNIIGYLEEFEDINQKPIYGKQHPARNLFGKVIKNMSRIYSVYAGYDDGSFYEVINLELNNTIKSVFGAPAEARWALITIIGGTKEMYTEFCDTDFNIITSTVQPKDYDPRKRPWYLAAYRSKKTERTDPYMFSMLKASGITFAKRLYPAKTVIGVDVSLGALSEFLESSKNYDATNIFLLTQDKEIMASTKNYDTEVYENIKNHKVPEIYKEEINGKKYIVQSQLINSEYWKGEQVSFAVPFSVMVSPYYKIIKVSFLMSVCLSVIIVPLIFLSTSIIVKPIKYLMEENKLVRDRRFREVKPVKTFIKEYQDLSNSMVEMAGNIESYQISQQLLFDAFIKLIAEAIDDKSKYTGGHCERVPVLAEMLAAAASLSDEEPFDKFKLEGEEEWRELHVSAWLHDCGKLVTPEFVVDKSTRLETIYNRIHEIRTRFEVIWRDIEIEMYRKKSDGVPAEEAESWLKSERESLVSDFTFIAELNDGEKFVSKDDIKRLNEIASREWVRNFDNRIGLSWEEQQRSSKDELTSSVEKLLSDKPEHIVKRSESDKEVFADNEFKMDIPDNQYNFGEVYNLTTSAGTLTKEERFIIQEHIVMTIKMLDKLPFPDHLKNVPEYACAHHEKVNGKGYPRQLDKETMSIPARIMAIADIFEALTAADRPYKKPKKLSDAVRVLSYMAEEGHIDSDLFKLFVKSGVYRDYGEVFLSKEQMDEVKVSDYV